MPSIARGCRKQLGITSFSPAYALRATHRMPVMPIASLPAATRSLVRVYQVKIAATLLLWCVPLLLVPFSVLEAIGFPGQTTPVFLRLLGCAYLSLCVGYGFGLQAARRGEIAPGPLWVGIVSNGGACAWLLYFGASGAFESWGPLAQWLMWISIAGTGAIALGLFVCRRP